MIRKKAELVFVPFPFWSHLKPAMEIAKLLVSRDDRLSITVILLNPPSFDPKYATYIESLVSSSSSSTLLISKSSAHGINFFLVPHRYSSTIITIPSYMEHQKPFVKNYVKQLISSSSSPPSLAGFVMDIFCTSMMDVGEEFGVPTYMLCTVSAGMVSLMFHLQHLHDHHHHHHSIDYSTDAELVLPSFTNPVSAKLLPKFLMNKDVFPLFMNHFRRVRSEAKGILINTFMELEPHALSSLSNNIGDDDHHQFPSVYTMGPILDLNSNNINGIDHGFDAIIKWLDGHPPSSVVFLCFGNLGTFGEDQVKEIAIALESSGIRFLWCLRHQQCPISTKMETFLKEFIDRTAEIGVGKIIADWAPQVSILSHRAIGGFVSHCGWNSIMESLWFGVPIAAWPLYGEQQFNAFELVRELELAVEVNNYSNNNNEMANFVSAKQIEKAIKKVMEHDSSIRKRVKEIHHKGRKAFMEGGSSYLSYKCLINNVIDNIPW